MTTTNEEALELELGKQDKLDDLFAILSRLKASYPQSKTHSASVTVKVGDHIEVSYSVTIVRGDL